MIIRHPVLLALWMAGLGLGGVARGQSGASGGGALEEIVVTGTSIRGTTPTASQAVNLGRDDMVATGAATSSDLARTLPQVFMLGADESRLSGAQDAAANTTRISGINLRGLGNEATLLLVNGRRIAPAGVIKSLYDPNVIPAGAVERMEVVLDGASAIYGSDAVAGVVNIITRKDFKGAETTLRYGSADGTDQTIFGQTAGYYWESGSVFGAFEYYDRDSLNGSDRDYASWDRTRRGGSDARSTQASPGNIVSGPTRYPLPAGDGTDLLPTDLVAGTPNSFDGGTFADLLPDQERKTLFVDARQHVGPVELWLQSFYTERDFSERVAPASGQLRVPSSNAYYVAPAALGTPASVNVEYRFLAEDAHPELVGYEDAHQNSVGFGWNMSANWVLSGYASFSRNNGYQRRGAITNGAALTAALASSDPARAFNPYGDGSDNLERIPDLVDIIIANRDTTAWSGTDDYALKADGPAWKLPGGELRLAFGIEHHEQSFEQKLVATNVLASGEPTVKRVDNERDFESYYAEALVPLFGKENAMPGLDRLELSLAVRHDDYSDFGTTTNPKYGLTWGPLPGFALRATYGTSFRAPSLVDTSEQIHNIFIQNLTDPLSSTGTTRGIFHNGGRATLQPEEAETLSFGLDWEPQDGALQGFRASVTWYDISYEDRIDVVPNTALTNESVYAPFIMRRPPASDTAGNAAFNLLVAAFLANPDLQSPVEPVTNINAIVDGRRANLGTLEQNGVDVNLAYAFSTSIGEWRAGLDWANIYKLERATAPGVPFVDVVDTFGFPIGNRARASLQWQNGGWQGSVYANYVDGYENTAVSPSVDVDTYTTWDVTLGYEFDGDQAALLDGLRLMLTVTDLTDEEPPVVLNGTNSWDNQVVSPLGRQVALTLSKSW